MATTLPIAPRKIATTVTASATLGKGKHTPVDATSGAKTMTLPTDAVAGVEISVEKVDASTNAVTVTGALRGVASSSIPLTSQYEARTFLSEGSGSWRPISDHRTKASLDTTYAAKRYLPVRGVGGDLRVITIMIYHLVNLTNFQTDCDYYQEWNYTTITPDDISNFQAGTGTLPQKPLMVTFDDGIASQYAAGQELNTRGMKGVFYVSTGWIDGTVTQAGAGFAEPTALTWTQLNQLKAWGHDIQSHTVTHTDLSTLTATQAATEFTNSKARIEAQVPGQIVRHIAYPYGACTNVQQPAIVAAGARTGRLVGMDIDSGGFIGANLGRSSLANTAMDPMRLPTAGTAYTAVMQANYHHIIHPDEDLVPDVGFEAGGKGWSLQTGFTVATDQKASGTRSLKGVQTTTTISSSTTRLIPVGAYAQLLVTGKIMSTLPAGTYAKVSVQFLKPDGTTVGSSPDAGIVTGPAGWTAFTYRFSGAPTDCFLRIYCLVQNSGAPSGAAWFDDISIKRDPAHTPFGVGF